MPPDETQALAREHHPTGQCSPGDVDLAAGPEEGGISLQRLYNSDPRQPHELGDGWEFDIGGETRIVTLDGGTRVVTLRGSSFRFKPKPDGANFDAPPEYSGALRRETDGTFTLTDDASTSTYRFPAGTNVRVANVTDSAGVRNDYTYGSGTFAITSTAGPSITTSASAGRIATLVQGGGGGTRRYEYTGGQLTGYVPPGASSATMRYEYDHTGRLRTLRASSGEVATVNYDAQSRVAGVTHTAGTATRTAQVTYSGPSAPCQTPRDVARATVIPPTGPAQSFCFDGSGRLTFQTVPDGAEGVHQEDEEIEYEASLTTPADTLTAPPDTERPCQPAADATATSYCYEQTAANPLYEDGSDGTIGTLAFGDAPSSADLAKGGIGWRLSAQNLHVDADGTGPGTQPVADLPAFRDFALRKVRFITPWDVVYRGENTERVYPGTTNNSANYGQCGLATKPRTTWCPDKPELKIVEDWLNAVTRGCGGPGTADDVPPCYQPIISFGRPRTDGELKNYLPTPTQYRAAIESFRAKFPNVRYFTAWNEPNDPDQPTNFRRASRRYGDRTPGPRRAGQYYRELRRICDNPPTGLATCYPAAGDFADNGTLTNEYIDLYRQGMATELWRVPSWAYHAYLAGRFRTVDGRRARRKLESAFILRSFIQNTAVPQAVRDRAAANGQPPPRNPRIWLTEQGGMVHRFRRAGFSRARSEREARRSVRFLLGSALQLSTRVNRFYYYAFDGDKDSPASPGDKFDSGLRSPYTGALRPVYADLRSYVNP